MGDFGTDLDGLRLGGAVHGYVGPECAIGLSRGRFKIGGLCLSGLSFPRLGWVGLVSAMPGPNWLNSKWLGSVYTIFI